MAMWVSSFFFEVSVLHMCHAQVSPEGYLHILLIWVAENRRTAFQHARPIPDLGIGRVDRINIEFSSENGLKK